MELSGLLLCKLRRYVKCHMRFPRQWLSSMSISASGFLAFGVSTTTVKVQSVKPIDWSTRELSLSPEVVIQSTRNCSIILPQSTFWQRIEGAHQSQRFYESSPDSPHMSSQTFTLAVTRSHMTSAGHCSGSLRFLYDHKTCIVLKFADGASSSRYLSWHRTCKSIRIHFFPLKNETPDHISIYLWRQEKAISKKR